jgi:predicted TIM-barrel fold metal-dependent hydrolase
MGKVLQEMDGACPDDASRRSFLRGMAALGTSMLIYSGRSVAQTNGNPRRIDVHHHFTPEAQVAFLKAHGRDSNSYWPWTLAKDLDDMEKNGTATAILSYPTPGSANGERNEIRKITRECNDAAAKMRSDHPGRFGSFASIPMADPEGALREMAYALDTLKADGISVRSNYGDKWLGNAAFIPVYEELNRRKAVVFSHPTTANCCGNLGLVENGVPNEAAMLEFGFDTTRTIADLIFSGMTQRFPNITWIFAHGGGVMPFLIERFFQGGASAEISPGLVIQGQVGPPVKNVPKGEDVLRELRKMYYDTAQTSNPVAMGALRKVVPVSRILFGTDYQFRTAEETGRALITGKLFNAQELQAINRGNAERLFPRLKGGAA